MAYKLLVLDLDGTLTNGKKKITERTKEVLIKAQQKGLRIALASGRPTYGIVPLAQELELKKYGGFILSYNGGEIIDCANGDLLYANVLNPEMIPYLYHCATDNGFAIVTYKDEYVLTEHPNDEYVLKEAILNVMKTKKVEHFPSAVDFPVAKCLIVGEAERLAQLEKKMYDELNDRMEVYRSEPYFLELVPKGIDKAKSLAVLLERLGWSRDEMMACGDGFNDLSMIDFAGMGVAMQNAQQVVKDVADYVTLSNEEDGVAHAVEKFFFGVDA